MKTVALVVALLLAAAGAGLLYLYKQRFEAEVGGGEKVEVMVTTADVKLGDTLTADKIATRGIPIAYVEGRHIRAAQISSVMGVRVRGRISAGETILWSDLAIAGANSRDLSGLVLPRMRAVAVQASAATTFDGLLRPGDRVDVLHTTTDPRTEQPVTRPLLQNVIVLAVGQHMGGGADGGGNRISTVTLGVKPEQGQALASVAGKLTVLLRNVDDIRILQEDAFTDTPEQR